MAAPPYARRLLLAATLLAAATHAAAAQAHPPEARSSTGTLNAEAFPGADIGARINTAFASGGPGSLVTLPPGQTYTFATTAVLPFAPAGVFPILDCQGSTLHFTGSGDALLVSPGGSAPWSSGLVRNCVLTGTARAANGIHQPARIGMHYRNVTISGFTGPSASGLLLDNTTFSGAHTGENGAGWNERLDADLNLFDNTAGLRAFGSNGGSNSFAYGRIDLRCQVYDAQWCLVLDGNGRGADMYGSLITLLANATFNKAPGGLIRSVNHADLRGPLTIQAESQGPVHGFALFTDRDSSIQGCGTIFTPGFLNRDEGASSRQMVSPTGGVCHTLGATFQPGVFFGNVEQARSSKWNVSPNGVDYYMASIGGVEGGSPFTLWARNTSDPGDPEADGQGKSTVLRADALSKGVGVGPGYDKTRPTHTLEFNGTLGNRSGTFGVTAAGNIFQPLHTPATSHEPCTPGQFSDDAAFHYVCTAPNTWKRAALSAF